ncbi:MAG: hypothetical protein D6710_10450, partial [Nitrospirae bacterium]
MTSVSVKDKSAIRREIIRRRDLIPPEVRAVKDRAIMERLLSYEPYASSQVVMLFASFRSEVNTFPLIEQALKEGKRVVLPVVNKEDRRLELYFL